MKKPKVEKVELPYASNVASFFGDQGENQGNSFMGRFFRGGGRNIVSRGQMPGPAQAVQARYGMSSGGSNGSGGIGNSSYISSTGGSKGEGNRGSRAN